MRKSKIISAIVITALAIASLSAHLIITDIQYGDNAVVRVYQNGEFLHEFSLMYFNHPFEVNGMVICVGGGVSVRSDCPNQHCVRMARVSSAIPIICVPNRVEIRITSQNNDLDGVTR
jgi:hypothetical protein